MNDRAISSVASVEPESTMWISSERPAVEERVLGSESAELKVSRIIVGFTKLV